MGLKFIWVLILIASCNKSNNKAHEHVEDLDLLQAKRDFYLKEVPKVQGEAGFLSDDHCDSLLWTSLASVGGLDADVLAAREDNGQWHRRPQMDCYPDGSKSSISRDMLLGVMWWALEFERKDVASGLISYGKAHNWFMGEGDPSRTFLTPALQATLADITKKLGGADEVILRNYPQLWTEDQKGFEAHLQVLHILLRGRVNDGIDDVMLKRLKEHVERNPLNPFFQFAAHLYTDGDQSEALSQLLKSSYFPDDRLPSSDDRCEEWLFQRDQDDKGWSPCGEGRTHHGGDLVFLTKLLEDAKKDE